MTGAGRYVVARNRARDLHRRSVRGCSRGLVISKQHRGRSVRSQHSRTDTPTTSATKLSIAKHTPGCLPVNAASGQATPRITYLPFPSTLVVAPSCSFIISLVAAMGRSPVGRRPFVSSSAMVTIEGTGDMRRERSIIKYQLERDGVGAEGIARVDRAGKEIEHLAKLVMDEKGRLAQLREPGHLTPRGLEVERDKGLQSLTTRIAAIEAKYVKTAEQAAAQRRQQAEARLAPPPQSEIEKLLRVLRLQPVQNDRRARIERSEKPQHEREKLRREYLDACEHGTRADLITAIEEASEEAPLLDGTTIANGRELRIEASIQGLPSADESQRLRRSCCVARVN